MKRFFVIIFFILSVVFGFNISVKASDTIVNNYARVTNLFNFNSLDLDTLQVDSLLDKNSKQLFFDGDTVLIHQTKDVVWGYGAANSDPNNQGVLLDWGVIGSFEIHIVKKVDVFNKYLILQGNLHLHPDVSFPTNLKPFNANHILQVVKVFTYRKKRLINKTITALSWDSIAKKGGIVAIIGDSIKLGGNIDVSGKGFFGANPSSIISNAHCSKEDSVKLKGNSFLRDAFDSAGLKGESYIFFDSFPRGKAPARSGGGGGNGYFAGGGGGGNYNPISFSLSSGGNGGDEGLNCGEYTTTKTGGLAGLSNYAIYNNNNVAALFGGGGGCSIQSATLKATKGGNGGGIIVIMANYLEGNGFSIMSNGSSVIDSASSGAGGGGAGGTILLDINKYKNSIVSTQGGNGGSTLSNLFDGSHGGGGGGGLIWYNGVKPDSINVSKGLFGNPPNWKTRNAQNGKTGGTKTSLRLPLYNFLYNIMPANQEICETDVPLEIKATDPKGGVNYEYLWQKSVNLSIWDSVGNNKLFEPPSLIATTYYRRIVRALTASNNLITTDTSYAVKINVLPKIVNNTIVKDTTEICLGFKFPYVYANNLLSGGNGKFKYKWQDSSGVVWHSSGMADSAYYRHPDSIKSIFLKLYVTSGACKSYTPEVKITVWQPIAGDSIAQNQWVEKGRMSNPLTSAVSLSGGSSSYTYLWQQSKNSLSWNSASIPNTLIGYTTPYFDSTRYYRRIVYSGQYNVCKDTSNVLKITILDSLTNNVISGNNTICAKTKPTVFENTDPIGGNGTYKYRWETSSPNQTSWVFSSEDTFKIFNPKKLSANTFFRRIVSSGLGDACKDTSNVIKITTVNSIINNTIFNKDTTVCNNQTPGILAGKIPSGGNGANKFIWLKSINAIDWDSVGSLSTFLAPILFDTTYYMRKVIAGVCIDTSDVLKVTVLPKIQNTFASENPHACYAIKTTIQGNVLGGNNIYKYNWQISNNSYTWTDTLTGIDKKDLVISFPIESNLYRRIVISGLNDCCRDTSKVLTLIIDSLPKSSFANFEKNVCVNSLFPINLELSGKPNFKINYFDGYTADSVSGINTSNYALQVTPDAQKTFTYSIIKLIDGNNCPAKVILGTGILNAYNKPTANAGKDSAFCGLVAQLHAIPSIGTGLWTSISGTDFGGNQTNSITQAIAPDFGSQVFTWNESNSGCKDSASITIRFDKQLDKSEIDAGDNQTNIFSFKAKLNASMPIVGRGRWSSTSNTINFEDSLKNNTEVSNLKLGTNIFIWTITNGVCKAVSDSVIVLNNDIKIPNGISPNNDNKNEKLIINGLDNVENAELFIINKWGTEVYHDKNYKNASAWDGGGLPPDTYYYILNVIGKTYKGYLVIRK